MIKRTSRSFKVPLVYGGQWKDHQTFQKWDPISKRLIQVNCCPAIPCFNPSPVDSVSLSASTGEITWVYGGSATIFEVKVYESVSLPIVPNGTVVFTNEGTLTSPYTATITPTDGYYYFASVRVKNGCGYSAYTYSNVTQYVCPPPDPIELITLSNLTGTTGDINWGNYGGTTLEISIYEGATSPVDTSGTPIVSSLEPNSKPTTFFFSQTLDYYYVAAVRAINACGYSAYSYSPEVQYGVTSYQFLKVAGTSPTSGQFTATITPPSTINFRFNKTDYYGNNVDAHLALIAATATTLTVTKNVSNFVTITITARNDLGSFWSFTGTIDSSAGTVNDGDIINLTYA
jgi:hypothetical protein